MDIAFQAKRLQGWKKRLGDPSGCHHLVDIVVQIVTKFIFLPYFPEIMMTIRLIRYNVMVPDRVYINITGKLSIKIHRVV